MSRRQNNMLYAYNAPRSWLTMNSTSMQHPIQETFRVIKRCVWSCIHLYRIRNSPQGSETIFCQALIMISKRNGEEGWTPGGFHSHSKRAISLPRSEVSWQKVETRRVPCRGQDFRAERPHPLFERSARYHSLEARATLLHHFHASKSILRFLFFFFSHFTLFWSSQVIVVKNTTPVGRFVKLYLFISLFRSLMSFSMRFFIEYSTFIAVSFL